jgi:outer membrane lipoprotein-sorting protein
MKVKLRTVVIVLVIVLLLATAGLVAATVIPSAEDLLIGSAETLDAVTSGHAKVSVQAELPERNVNGSFEVWGKLNVGPNGEPAARLVILAADDSEHVGVTLASDGSQFWLYNPHLNTVVVGQAEELAPLLAERLAEYESQYGGQWDQGGEFDPESVAHPQTPAEAVAMFLEYFTAERNGSDQVGENEADIVRLVPIPEQMPEEVRLAGGFVNLWLRAEDQLPLAAEYAEGSIGYVKIEAAEIEINQDIDEGTFTFDIPEDATVLEATDLLAQMEPLSQPVDAAEAGVLIPSELPADAEAAGSEQIAGTIVQRFTLPEGKSFVIAQGPEVPQDVPAEATSSETVTVRGVEGTLHVNDEATRTLLIWQEEGAFFLVGGDLNPEQALAIAESLQ